MNLALINQAMLICTAVLIGGAMTLAWRHFGRPVHAKFWAWSAACSATQWSIGAISTAAFPGSSFTVVSRGALVVTATSLLAMGALSRGGLPIRWQWFAVCGFAATLVISLTVPPSPDLAARGVVTNLYATIVLTIASWAIVQRGRPTAPEIAVGAVFAGFALFTFFMAVLCAYLGADGRGPTAAIYGMVLMIGLPGGYAALSIALVFLLATDLAARSQSLITRDSLTGSLNRRGVEQAAVGAIADARRNERSLCLILCDIDSFKSVNDRFGHTAGDRALTVFSDTVQAALREEDIFGRLDADEFCILVIGQNLDATMELVARVRDEIEPWPAEAGLNHPVTVSFAITCLRRDEDVGLSDLLTRADGAMRRAKTLGPGGTCTDPER